MKKIGARSSGREPAIPQASQARPPIRRPPCRCRTTQAIPPKSRAKSAVIAIQTRNVNRLRGGLMARQDTEPNSLLCEIFVSFVPLQ